MYIAAPPDEMDMLNRVKLEIMKKLPTVQIYLSTQVKFWCLSVTKIILVATFFGRIFRRSGMPKLRRKSIRNFVPG